MPMLHTASLGVERTNGFSPASSEGNASAPRRRASGQKVRVRSHDKRRCSSRLPHKLIEVELWRIWRQNEQTGLPLRRVNIAFDLLSTMRRMSVDDQKDGAALSLYQTLKKIGLFRRICG